MPVSSKKCSAMVMALILCFTLAGTALAADTHTKALVVPQWINTNVVDISLSFSGSRGSCGACVFGKTGTTQITGTAVLSQKNSNGTYTTVKTWSGLQATGSKLIFDATYYVEKGYTYRLTIIATVYRNNTGETVLGHYDAYAA